MASRNPPEEKKYVNILSFDGGGSRGIMEVSILSDVMRLATVLLQDPETLSYLLGPEGVSTSIEMRTKLSGELAGVTEPLHPNEVYDMIVGTSTGALIAFGLVGGNSDEDDNRLPMTLEECINMYKERTKEIFKKSWTQSFLSWIPGLGGVPLATYSKENVKEALDKQFDDSSLACFQNCPTIAGAVARQIGRNEELVLFDTRSDAYKLYKTVQVLQATTNAPVYFDTPVKIGDKEFVDGGVGGNCPLVQAIARAKKLFGDEVEIKSALSVAPPSPKESEVPTRFQVKYWLNYFVELSTNGYAVYQEARRRNKATKFHRLSPRGESLKVFKLDEINADKMLKALDDERLNNDMFLVDVIATAAFVVDTYLRKTMERPENTVKQAAKLAHMAGKIYSRKFEYELANKSYKTSLSLWEMIADEDSEASIFEIREDIAECLVSQGRYQRACNLLQKTVEYWKSYSNEAKCVNASFKLAECLLLDSSHEKAKAMFMEVLEKQRTLYGKDTANAKVASTLNRLGWCLREQGDYDQAILFYLEALTMRKQLCPSGDDLDIAETLNSLGLTYSELGSNANAVKHAKDSLEMRQRLSKEESNDLIAESLNNLGRCQVSNSNYKEAQVNLEIALKMKKELYGDVDHPSIAITLENMAECLLLINSTDETDSALPLAYAQQALKMKKVCMGDVNNSAIAKTHQIIGHCFEKARNYIEATKFYKFSMRIIRFVFHRSHPRLVHILSRLGHSLFMQEEYADAKFYLQKAMNIEMQRNKDSPMILSLSEEIAKCDIRLAEGFGQSEKTD